MALIEKVASKSKLYEAWASIKHRPQSKGLDSVTIADFSKSLWPNLLEIGRELRSNNYKFTALRGHAAAKPDGDIRPLRIAAVRDRVVQKSIESMIHGRLERRYKVDNPVSFAYIKAKSAIRAIKRVRDLYLLGYKWIYSGDIQHFFESVPPDRLLHDYVYPALLPDRTLNTLLADALSNEIGNLDDMKLAGCESQFLTGGIPQGGILSPFFANIYLHEFDRAMIDSSFELVRYADDFVIMCRSREDAFRAFELAKNILEGKLGLKLHEVGGGKSSIERFNVLEFLGVRFEGQRIFPGSKITKKVAKLLKDFADRPPRNTMLENLNYIREKTNFWAATYFYTDMRPDIYDSLDSSLARGVVRLLGRHNFIPRRGPYFPEALDKLGVPTFSESMRLARSRKREALIEFYPDAVPDRVRAATA